ncbi:MAG: PaaI family thioesterase [Pseudomonadales bacterium]|nr:PaaI family thioesterase [Pseudomonadales bacterium]
MTSPFYQNRDNLDQLQALEKLADETRQLINNVIDTAADTQTLNQLCAELNQLNTQFSVYKNNSDHPRPIQHFNYNAATEHPSEILPYSPMTGAFNPIAPPVQVSFDAESQILTGTVICTRAHEGPQGMAHGATIAGIFDQVLAMAATCIGKGGPTAYLNTQFLKPTWLDKELIFTASIDRIEGRKIFIKGECRLDGELISTADALCIEHRF